MTIFTKTITLSMLAVFLTSCADLQRPENEWGETNQFMCGETPLSVFGGEHRAMHINVSGNSFPVLETQSLYGTKYEDLAGQQVITFWDKGDTAILELGGKPYPACQKVRNPDATVLKNYLAIGNDPAWHLIIRDGKVIFNSMYREKIVMADLPDSQITASGQNYVFKTGAQDMRITMTNQACKDTLTSRLYPEQISILFQGKELTGCGNRISGSQADSEFHAVAVASTQPEAHPAPAAPNAVPTFTRKTWVARQIDGANVLTPSRLTLAMSDEGLYLVNGGCNQFSGTYKTQDKNLTVDPKMVETKKICAADLIKQEKIFTGILKASTLIDVRGNTLIISTPHRKTITFTLDNAADPLVIVQ